MKLIKDILTHNGKYGRKSVYSFLAFLSAIIIETVFPIFEIPTKEYVFITLITFVGGTLGLTVWDKKTNVKEEITNEEP